MNIHHSANPYLYLFDRKVTSSFDAAAAAYFSIASITGSTEKTAWNNFVVSSKAANLWTGRVVRIYPASPTSLSAARYCAKTLLQRPIQFFNAPTHSALGLTYNGFNQALHLDGQKSLTNLTSQGLIDSDYTIMIYVNALITPPSSESYFCGTANYLEALSPAHTAFGNVTVGNGGRYLGNPQSSGALGAAASGPGLISMSVGVSEIESGASQLSFNGSLDTSDVVGVDSAPVQPFFTGGAAAGVYYDTESMMDVYGIYKGINYREGFTAIYRPHLTSAEETILYPIIQAYQTALGRNV